MILAELEGAETILDLGCGPCSIVGRRKSGRAYGVDIYEPYLAHAQQYHTHDLYVQDDILNLRCLPKSFDVVLMSEVLEHLDKGHGLVLLAMAEEWARRKVVVKVPNGYVPQPAFDGNPYQEHRSAWTLDDLQSLGYTVSGASGWKPLRGSEGKVKLWPYFFGDRISDVTQLAVRHRPRLAFQLFAVKSLA